MQKKANQPLGRNRKKVGPQCPLYFPERTFGGIVIEHLLVTQSSR